MGKNKKRKPVVVVSTPSAFPDFTSFGTSDGKPAKRKKDTSNSNVNSNRNGDSTGTSKRKLGVEIDFDDAIREVHKLGSTQFTGKQKKEYEAEAYKALTGREKKKQKVPMKIVRGIKKAAAKREKRVEIENKEAGIVTAVKRGKVKKSYSETNRRNRDIHGPAPDIGFMKGGKYNASKHR